MSVQAFNPNLGVSWIGLSTDPKPSDAPAGARFFAVKPDLSVEEYIFGPGGWSILPGKAVSLVAGAASVDGSLTLAASNVAQNLWGGTSSVTPVNGFELCCPDADNDIWFSDSGPAVINGVGSMPLRAGGGYYRTPTGYKPLGPVSVISSGPAKITARRW